MQERGQDIHSKTEERKSLCLAFNQYHEFIFTASIILGIVGQRPRWIRGSAWNSLL
jgi:hypothetical protein